VTNFKEDNTFGGQSLPYKIKTFQVAFFCMSSFVRRPFVVRTSFVHPSLVVHSSFSHPSLDRSSCSPRLTAGFFIYGTIVIHIDRGGNMKILAMEKEIEGIKPEQFTPHLKSEAAQVWKLVQDGLIRETYFRTDRTEAVLMLECTDPVEAQLVLQSLPLVKEGLICFEVIPLKPYSGFARLFENQAQT